MGLDQAVSGAALVAGLGFRRGTPATAIVALIRRALAEAGHGARLAAIATAADRADDPAVREAAAHFGLEPEPVEAAALERADSRVRTRSARIERLRGVGSLAEAAALAAAGEDAHLVLARIDDGRATCSLALTAWTASERASPPPEAEDGGPRAGEGREPSSPGNGDATTAQAPRCRGTPAPSSGDTRAPARSASPQSDNIPANRP